jgi:hypothetical protein
MLHNAKELALARMGHKGQFSVLVKRCGSEPKNVLAVVPRVPLVVKTRMISCHFPEHATVRIQKPYA